MRYYVSDRRLEPEYEEPLLTCDNCSYGIYFNEIYYNIDGFNLCEVCISDMEKIAE